MSSEAAGAGTAIGRRSFLASPVEGVEQRVGPPASAHDWWRLLAVAVELGLLSAIVHRFQIGSYSLSGLFVLAVVGFVLNSLLPLRFRLACFVLVSLSGLLLVLGPENAAWLIGIGLVLIGLCHLPLPTRAVAVVVAAAGAGLIAMRAGFVRPPWPPVIWPVLGSLFMFRIGMFLHDRSQGERARSIWETLGYFFLLPNVCFTLFPVVDYKVYRRSWYADDQWQCAQKGVRWITRGLIHLILYRFIYYYGVLAPSEVATPGELVQYLITNFGLYLRVSGIFHLAVGMLRLYGFALPETHFMYFLSASVNDFWRRANIYWKDFMLKFFYLPLFFRWRRQGETRAFVLSTVIVVAVTWALHSYQWFWLRGAFPVRWQDGAFWASLGSCMIWNTLRENRQKGARGRRARTWTVQNAFGQGLRILVTFTFLSLIWSLWSCESWAGWLAMMSLSGDDRGVGDVITPTLVILPVALVVLATEGAATRIKSVPRSALLTSLGLVIMLGFSFPGVYTRLGDKPSEVVQSLRVVHLNRLDAESLQRGYYEDLLDVDRFNPELARVLDAKPANWVQLEQTIAMQPTDDWRLAELVPSIEIPYKGAILKTNSDGLRDREYARVPAPGVVRFALIGASYVMGSGVENDETFEALVERRLNAEQPFPDVTGYEVINFAVGGSSPLQRMAMVEHKALDYDPDVLLFVSHENELFRIGRSLTTGRTHGQELRFDELQAIVDKAGLAPDATAEAYERALEPLSAEILGWCYRRVVSLCRERGVTPVWVFLPTLEMRGVPAEIAWLPELARASGFEIIDLFGVYGKEDLFSLRIADWDYHPNARGHELIAARLYAELLARPELFVDR